MKSKELFKSRQVTQSTIKPKNRSIDRLNKKFAGIYLS